MLKMTKEERDHQIAFAERQFEIYKMRVLYNQSLASQSMVAGLKTTAENHLARTHRFIVLMEETNEFIDKMRRMETTK